MKKIFFVFCGSVFSLAAFAQTKAAARSTNTASSAVNSPVLKTLADSASYALGYNIASSLKQDIGDLNTTILTNAIKDAFAGKPSAFPEEKAYEIFQSYSAKAKEQKAGAEINKGKEFLEKNKQKPGVRTTASGLQYEVLKEGIGIKPAESDTAICHYTGTLLDGTEFDNSYKRGEPLTIPVGSVIKGWTEGLQLMSKGSKYKFYIPYELGYGLRGAPPTIPGGAALIFEVELLDVKK